MKEITSKTKLCMVIGDPVEHSLSPRLHNYCYRELGINHEYVMVAARVSLAQLKEAVSGFRALGVRGISCTIPHKVSIMTHLDQVDPSARKIGAINTVVNEGGKLIGYNTDVDGIVEPIEAHGKVNGKRVAVIGAGGAARAAVIGFTLSGASVCIFNRSADKGEKLAKEMGCTHQSLDDVSSICDFDVVFNATSVGMAPKTDLSPLPKECFRRGQLVFDAVYRPAQTTMLRWAESAGAHIISGTEMFICQARKQIELYTGHKVPMDVMRDALKVCLGGSHEKS